ncbi:hypothetical protein BVC93_24440 [Mycobacterium sp. MS1601]|uniref:bifunctional DNA primase/polymerase n=1 Tax=Mycobacterium sp. MS1601 TaxID=1936029 RepID=UPI00097969B5|nr:bifunctional DNA primase/polymerase [Mycobacterium sp. MS1601]AQA05030.1 hypothetical protein BVC93_24440 [Mycobacterium sp. MS1601]
MNDTAHQSTRAELLTALLADAPKPDDHGGVGDYLRRLAELGCAPLFVYPGTKAPSDMRAPRQRIAEDRAAQEAARGAGRRNWQKVKSPSGVYLATNNTDTLDRYLKSYGKTFGAAEPVNLAVSVGRSRLVVVDCDTAAQLSAFLADARADPDTPPTVRTPGAQTDRGEWIHSDGGHFWFTVPDDVELPSGVQEVKVGTGADAYSVFWGPGKYVLMPPSVRAEGAYEVPAGGAVHELPDWLGEVILERATAAARVADRSTVSDTTVPIADWSRAVDWAEILTPLGWTPTGRSDSCGCPTWTAPGEHSSPKSATAHEPGCTEPRYDDNPPMHIWTDNPGEPFAAYIARSGKTTLSKLQAVAAVDFDNDMGAAMNAHGLFPDPQTIGRGDSDGQAAGENLPESFWAAQSVLGHIRQAAHRGVNAADAVLGAVLARLAAHLDPCITVDTGIKQPMPLSMFVGLVGSAGTGKSSAHAAAGRLLEFRFPPLMMAGMVTRADESPLELPVGSGPGLAEAFMGAVVDPLNPTKGKPVRRQVSHKLLLHSDEGAGLVAGILDAKRGQDIGPALRTAWTGAVLGQANASSERKRQVRDYVVGLCVGFQLGALADMSTPEQLEYGTPQRFLYLSATDPAIPDDAPDDPGPLTVTLPSSGLRYSDELQARARTEALARTRGQAAGEESEAIHAHRPAMLARLAALLVVLCDPGRSVIEIADVELAEVLLDCSARLHDTAMAYARERKASEDERKVAQRISEQVAMAVAVDGRDAALSRMRERILKYVDAAGGRAKWPGQDGMRKLKFKGPERQLVDAAAASLVDDGTVRFDGDQIERM